MIVVWTRAGGYPDAAEALPRGPDRAGAGRARPDGRGTVQCGDRRALRGAEGTVEKHVRSILMKLQLPESAEVHRLILAVLAFLDAN